MACLSKTQTFPVFSFIKQGKAAYSHNRCQVVAKGEDPNAGPSGGTQD